MPTRKNGGGDESSGEMLRPTLGWSGHSVEKARARPQRVPADSLGGKSECHLHWTSEVVVADLSAAEKLESGAAGRDEGKHGHRLET